MEYLEHHGIQGQKWGVRRFQNTDGTLTPEGVERYRNVDRQYAEGKVKGYNKLVSAMSKAKHSSHRATVPTGIATAATTALAIGGLVGGSIATGGAAAVLTAIGAVGYLGAATAASAHGAAAGVNITSRVLKSIGETKVSEYSNPNVVRKDS